VSFLTLKGQTFRLGLCSTLGEYAQSGRLHIMSAVGHYLCLFQTIFILHNFSTISECEVSTLLHKF